MRSMSRAIPALAAALMLISVGPAVAQDGGFGIGGHLSMIRGDAHADAAAERFTGGQIRAHLSKRAAIELSLDLKTVNSTDLTERTRDFPIQGSLLLYPVRAAISPYVLAGVGWYTHRVEQLADKQVISSETTRKFGSHAGFGGQLRLGNHAAIHADYRYTFLHFGDDAPAASAGTTASSLTSRSSLLSSPSNLLPGYRGSMWTAGLTVYF